MIGLDTNVLVRYFSQDDSEQSPKATRLIESLTAQSPGHISLTTLVELAWVMTKSYTAPRSEICEILEILLRTKELAVAEAETVWKAVRRYKDSKADFADCLISSSCSDAGCDYVVSFDRGAVKHCGMKLLD